MSTFDTLSLVRIKSYILSLLESNKEDFFYNELELQMFVARGLERKLGDGYKVHLEYQLPHGWNKKFDYQYERWGTEKPYFDIVIEDKCAKFIVIELKYKLKEIKLKRNSQFSRFGINSPSENFVLVSNHSAENEGRYDFWKDVKRIEALKMTFTNVLGGIAIFVTNQQNYRNNHTEYKYSNFNLSEHKSGFLYWNTDKMPIEEDTPGGEKLKDNNKKERNWGTKWKHWVRPNFKLERTYSGEWREFSGPLEEMFYCYAVTIR